jgi:hypothetical protein
MENEKHSMDEIFQVALKDQETPPPADVWFNIQKALDSKKRIKFLWTLRALAATITLLVTFASGYYIANYKNNSVKLAEKQNTSTQTKTLPIQQAVNQPIQNKTAINLENPVSSDIYHNDNQQVVKSVIVISTTDKSNSILVNDASTISEESNLIYLLPIQANLPIKEFDHSGISILKIQPIFTSRLSGEEIVVIDKKPDNETKGSRWSLGGQVSPLYAFREISGSGGNANTAVNQFVVPKESGIVSYSGGLNVEYKASKRLSVSSGLYYSRMGQNINGNQNSLNILSNSFSPQADQLTNYSFQNSTGTLNRNSAATYGSETTAGYDLFSNAKSQNNSGPTNALVGGESATLLQSMDFLEIPVILRYKIIDRKVGLHILGGVSTQVLTGNKLLLETSSGQQDYGSTGGLSTFNYSSTVGFGLDYTISSRIHLNLEPAFKYYINSINSSGNIESHPYSFGIYTGMRYTF